MKKVLICVFLSVFLVSGSALADTSIQPEAGDLLKDQAVNIAIEQFLKVSGLDQSGLQDYAIVADLYEAFVLDDLSMPRRWQIVFTLSRNAEIWYTVLVASPSGALYSAEPNNFSARLNAYTEDERRAMAIEQGEVLIKENGPWEFWSYEDKDAFALAYGRYPNGELAEHGLPGEQDIPLDQAVAIGKSAIVEHFSISDNQINALILNARFILFYNTVATDTPSAWMLGFHSPAVNANGDFPMLYQAIIVSPGGAIERLYEMDYHGQFDQKPVVTSWPPEGQSAGDTVVIVGSVYYNGRGGKYYHMDAQCSSVSPEYFPLTAIDINQLSRKPYNVLRPCPSCVK